MELIVISSSKLKIMLTAPDMQHYELQGNTLSYINESVRRAFRHIFNDVKAQAGFDTTGEKLFVQLYASRDGGCEIFVTKLGISEEIAPLSDGIEETSATSSLTAAEETLLRRVWACESEDENDDLSNSWEDRYMDTPISTPIYHPKGELHTVILSVHELPILLAVCRRLLKMGYDDESYAYIAECASSPIYHLILDVPDGGFYLLPERYAFLKEYGEVKDMLDEKLYLSEHGRLLCEGEAVEILGQL